MMDFLLRFIFPPRRMPIQKWFGGSVRPEHRSRAFSHRSDALFCERELKGRETGEQIRG